MINVRYSNYVICLFVVLFATSVSHADLTLIGQGSSIHGTYNMIYDDHLDITWYDYTTSPSSWGDQISWVNGLSVTFEGITYTDWRLPITDESCSDHRYCTSSEMGHLYYTDLGNQINGPLANTGDFQNLLNTGGYWSDTVYSGDTSRAWFFDTQYGYQYYGYKNATYYDGVFGMQGLAVIEGSLGVVPEPISSVLFLTGGALLAGRKYLIKKMA